MKKSRITEEDDGNYNPSKLHKDIGVASAGLCYISEIDSEVHPFIEENLLPETLKSLHKLLKNEKHDAGEVERFSKRLTEPKDWQNEKARSNTVGFKRLFEVLHENLRDIRIVRLGEVEFDIFVVGLDRTGNLAGVRMRAMET